MTTPQTVLEDMDGAPYPEEVQKFARELIGRPDYDTDAPWIQSLVTALESVARPYEHEVHPVSVQPDWARALPIQQQSVLFLGARGPDGIRKHHPCKELVKAYRACVLKAATLRREITPLDQHDGFMDASVFGKSPQAWHVMIGDYFAHVDELPHHYHLHLVHGAEILGYHHPDPWIRSLWRTFYVTAAVDLHMTAETAEEMNDRLNDFGTSVGGQQQEHTTRAGRGLVQ